MSERVRLRIVLRESDAGAIYDHAGDVSNPHPERELEKPRKRLYGEYATRAEVTQWGNPSLEDRARVLALFPQGSVHEIATSPLVFVTASEGELEQFFKPGTLSRLTRDGIQVRAWECAGELAELERVIKTIHAFPLGAEQRAPARKGPFGDEAPPPSRGWLFPHLERKSSAPISRPEPSRRALSIARAPRLEDGATPELIRSIYNFPAGLRGKDETIALMSLGSSDPETRAQLARDLTQFWKEYGIEADERVEHVEVGPRSDRGPLNPLYRLEATMGPAWIGAIVPDAKIVIYEMALDLPDPWLAAVEMAVADEKNRPTILCMTWTMPEEFYYRQFDRSSISLALAKAAALGITVVVAAGDWGVYDGRPGAVLKKEKNGAKVARAAWPHATFPSTEDGVLSVGGTLISTLEPLTETAWSGPLPPDPELAKQLPFVSFATSGGFSQRVPVPGWQTQSVLGFDEARVYSRGSNTPAVVPYGRGYPDVSLMAAGPSVERGKPASLSATGYRLVIDGEWIDYAGGTSMAAPIWASAIAVINQRRASDQRPRLGFANPLLYYFGRTRPSSGDFAVLREIQNGASDIEFRVVTSEGATSSYVLAGYRAAPEWDPVTGLGVPDVTRLSEAFLEFPGPRESSRAGAEL